MKATLKKVDQIRQQIDVEIPPETVDAAYATALEKVRAQAKIPGFRQGKVPDAIIEQRFGDEIRVEAVQQVVRDTYPKAVAEVGARPLGDPRIEPQVVVEKGKPFNYKANIEVYPEFTAEGYDGLSLEREKIEVTDDEVDAELKRLQRHMTQLEPLPTGEVGPGVVAMIDFKGTANGQPFPGSEAENYVVDFGTGGLLEEFEVQIKGMKAADERDIEFSYPADYFKHEIAGKKGAFRVRVKEVRRKIVPELNDDFAKDVGQFESLGQVRENLKLRIGEYKEAMVQNMLRERAIRMLIEKHKDLEAPTVIVEAELGNMLNQLDSQLKAQGRSLAEAKVDPKEFVKVHAKEAADRAKGYMIMEGIANQENIQVADEEVEKRIEAIAAQNRQPTAKIREHLEKNSMLTQLRGQIRFEKTLDFIVGRAKIKELKPKKEKK